jgi:hypothetical protein
MTDKNKFDVHKPPQLFWIYTHENTKNELFHTHFLVGIPDEMRKEFRKWVANRIAGIWKKKCKSDGKIMLMPKKIVKVKCPSSRPIIRQWYLFHYLCKGLDPMATVEIPGYPQPVPLSNFIQSGYCNPGHITCKSQIGLSRNLCRTERKKFEYKSKMELGFFDKRELYTSDLYDRWHKNNPDPRRLDVLDL